MAAGFTVKTAGATALVGGTAKTLVNVIAGANRQAIVCEISSSFDGVTASAVPVLVELVGSTQATAGTVGTSPTPTLIRGLGASQATAAESYTAEPTVLTQLKQWLVTPNGGLLVVQFPLGRETQSNVSGSATLLAVGIRDNAPANVNARAYVEFEE
jgi:hypothetical protein